MNEIHNDIIEELQKEHIKYEKGLHLIFNVDDDINLDGLMFINENELKDQC